MPAVCRQSSALFRRVAKWLKCDTNGTMTRASEKEIRDAPLSIRTKPSIKALADRFALEDDRSVTQIIERLLIAEAERRADASKKKTRL